MVPVEKGWIELQQSPHLSFKVNKPFHPRKRPGKCMKPNYWKWIATGGWTSTHRDPSVPRFLPRIRRRAMSAPRRFARWGTQEKNEDRVRLVRGCKVTCFGLAACGYFLLRDSWCYLRYKYLFEARHMTFSGPATDFPALPESKG